MTQITIRTGFKVFLSTVALSLLFVFLLGYTPLFLQEQTGEISGVVVDEEGPVANALVRLQATESQALTDEDGTFTINNLPTEGEVTLVAWSEGYFFGVAETTSQQESVTIEIKRHHQTDSLDYEWETSENCGECHPSYAEWQRDAHGQSAVNHRFLTMYQGVDVQGNKSKRTNYHLGLPRSVDPDQPHYGPGFKTDFPDRDGNCSTCHVPMVTTELATDNTCGWSGCHAYETMDRSDEIPDTRVLPLELDEVAAEGISCDFCHKVNEVYLEKETGLPDPERTGILSLGIYRPEPGERFFVGSIDDVARETDSYNPLYKESAICASCHFGSFGEVPIYNSYGEWLESPYSEEMTGQTCQDCHMPVAEPYDESPLTHLSKALNWFTNSTGTNLPLPISQFASRAEKNYFVYPEYGGVYRDPEQVHNHQMPGANNKQFLQNAVTMVTDAQIQEGQILVSVNITNDKTGHHVPTGSPLRHLILVVEVKDGDGNALTVENEALLLPEWAGNYAGQPGKAYAKVLKDDVTGEVPTFAHWRTVSIASDTRIPAMESDITTYAFGGADSIFVNGPITVETKLIFRRAFQQLMEWKGWDDPDILMEENRLEINPSQQVAVIQD